MKDAGEPVRPRCLGRLELCFPDENSAARHVADRFKQGDIALAASFWPHEVLNALLAGEKRKRIPGEAIQAS